MRSNTTKQAAKLAKALHARTPRILDAALLAHVAGGLTPIPRCAVCGSILRTCGHESASIIDS